MVSSVSPPPLPARPNMFTHLEPAVVGEDFRGQPPRHEVLPFLEVGLENLGNVLHGQPRPLRTPDRLHPAQRRERGRPRTAGPPQGQGRPQRPQRPPPGDRAGSGGVGCGPPRPRATGPSWSTGAACSAGRQAPAPPAPLCTPGRLSAAPTLAGEASGGSSSRSLGPSRGASGLGRAWESG